MADGIFGTDGRPPPQPVSDGHLEEAMAQLRFVEREGERIHPGVPRKLRILQQMWQITNFGDRGERLISYYEWRDVPLELEGLIDA